eukprot:TRINITY_DN38101_c0_g2_i4.p1 TRINITY_DN38101_c0_g2~~TRINITY_DN38101_c0_g2_i4.p1  ORF type:complete len:115 (-),score=6.20 TRINITY_DN38101_c0_g2_i4:24-368(-)
MCKRSVCTCSELSVFGMHKDPCVTRLVSKCCLFSAPCVAGLHRTCEAKAVGVSKCCLFSAPCVAGLHRTCEAKAVGVSVGFLFVSCFVNHVVGQKARNTLYMELQEIVLCVVVC